jgi:hypothetical protein
MPEGRTNCKGVKNDQNIGSCFSSEFTNGGGVARHQVIVSTKPKMKSTKSTTELAVSWNAGKGEDKQNISIIWA